MEVLLSKVTQQAMNYAIRTGITITSGFAIQQCSRLLKSVKGSSDKTELVNLQMRLESKISIISPSIDMIEMMAARGNTTLESAVTLTKALRWDIQALGVRLSKAAADEELARKGSPKARTAVQMQMELKSIIVDIKNLLLYIERSVPDISLAIATSGVNFTTRMPDHVSPSRLLQASTLLTSGDVKYSENPSQGLQICPDFIVSMYMLFSGHTHREETREFTWKEVMHKARLKINRVPIDQAMDYPGEQHQQERRPDSSSSTQGRMSGDGLSCEYAYQLLVIEDYDDGRVHDDEDQTGPYGGVVRPGIRELIPIHEISKIFYADTSKMLNIGTDSETNSPVLLLRRDVNAVKPRRMMRRRSDSTRQSEEDGPVESPPDMPSTPQYPDEQSEVDAQLHRESPGPQTPQSETLLRDSTPPSWRPVPKQEKYRIPPNLDREWIAFEVYTEDVPDSDSDYDANDTDIPSSLPGTPASRRSSSRRTSVEPTLMSTFSRLNFHSSTPSPASTPAPRTPPKSPFASQIVLSPQKHATHAPQSQSQESLGPIPQIRTSLSLLEMLIRLTSLQQFQQTSHLAIPDELLTFFLSESSTVGAGGDSEKRQRVRLEARQRVGFDPYDESPIKRRGEAYLAQSHEDQYYAENEGRQQYDLQDYREEFQQHGGRDETYEHTHVEQRFSPAPASLPRRSLHLLHGTPHREYSSASPWSRHPADSSPSAQAQNRAVPSPLLRKATASNATETRGGQRELQATVVDAPFSSPMRDRRDDERRGSGYKKGRLSLGGFGR